MATVKERRDRILQLRAAGMTLSAIAEVELTEGLVTSKRSIAAISGDIKRALRERGEANSATRDDLVTLELERLDLAHRAAETALRSAQGGRCGACGRGGDPAQVMAAIDRILRVGERRSRLQGLDAKAAPEEQKISPLERSRAAVALKLVQ